MSERDCLNCKSYWSSILKYPCACCRDQSKWEPVQPVEPEVCEWTKHLEHGYYYYETSCKQYHEFHGYRNPDFKYCPYCSKVIKEVIPGDDETYYSGNVGRTDG